MQSGKCNNFNKKESERL